MTEINNSAVDRYTSAHAGVGATVASWDIGPLGAFGIAMGWEVVENLLKDSFPEVFPYDSHDSAANAVADVVANLVAYGLTRRALKTGLSPRARIGLDAAIGSTIGGILGSVLLGAPAAIDPDLKAKAAQGAGRVGYRAGTTVGGAVGGSRTRRLGATVGGGVGGAFLGPVGAGIGAWIGHGD